MNELTIRIAGEAGQGMQTVGIALCQVIKASGFHLFANHDYMSRIRGGNNFFQVRISNVPIYTLRRKCDIVVALDKPSVSLHKDSLVDNGVMVLDKKKFNVIEEEAYFFDTPFYEIAKNIGGGEIFINSVACGVIMGLIKLEFRYLEEVLKNVFSDKNEEIVKKNIESASAGYDFSRNNFKKSVPEINGSKQRKSLLTTGNDAISFGAIRAGCKFYSAYPMSPSTSIMNSVAHYADKFNIIVEQAEDEIAAVNMVIGASLAGARAMTATSGGGFALMVEGLSLSGMTETPIIVVDAQRPAPATGFPTRTEQADLDFLISAGHGEFARAIFSPGSIEEAFYLTIKAFNLAEKYQIPVLIMTDQHLADSYRDIEMLDMDKIKVQRYIYGKEESKNIVNYRRYALTESGISPRAIPSWINDVIYYDSDEHNEDGHITEDADIRIKMVTKRFYKKMSGLSQEIEEPKTGNLKNSSVVLIGFGSTYGVLKEASELIKDIKVGFIHLPQVWPFPKAALKKNLRGHKKIVTVENNAGAQLAKLLQRETGIKVANSILKFDGRPFSLDEVIDKVREKILAFV